VQPENDGNNAANFGKDIEGIQFVRFGAEDVVRHHLVQEIIQAFDEYDGRNDRKRSAPSKGGDRR
jgi:phosphate starvation-inducible protein PhoH